MFKSIRWWLFLCIGFYLAAVLMVLPLPQTMQWYRPQWVLMLFIYCQLVYPKTFNPVIAWVGGIFVDVLVGMPLGIHALVYTIVCYIASLLRTHFIMRPLWKQVGKIALFFCLSQILLLWCHALSGKNPHTLLYWMSTVTSCIFWVVFVKLLRPYTPRSI